MGMIRMDVIRDEPFFAPRAEHLVAYIEDMLLELAELASKGGETALAASLAIAAIQAGSRRGALSG